MHKLKYLILGAGPSGLTIAYALLKNGISSDRLLLMEKESVAGGLCRSEQIDGAPLDICGAHFLDVRNNQALNFLFSFLPKQEWNEFDRISKICLRGMEIDYPLEANLWQLPEADQIDYRTSMAQAGSVHGKAMPESFAAWVEWKLGKRIAEDYILPYNRKIWSMDLNMIGSYWMHKLPDVDIQNTLLNGLDGRQSTILPAHARYFYPKRYGYGELWRRMGAELGSCLITNCPVETLDLATRTVNGQWQADFIINTIPWTLWPHLTHLPAEIEREINKLRSVGINIDYFSENPASQAHWIYDPSESVPHHRLILRSNFCPRSRGFYTETNISRSDLAVGWRHSNEFSYPVNTIGKPESIAQILHWAANNRIYGIGRWGKWEHLNSDTAVCEALDFAEKLLGKEIQ